MKLLEVVKDPCIGIIADYVMIYTRRPGLDKCIDRLIADEQYQYNGPMYRAVGFDPRKLNANITNILQSYTSEHKYHSWCPSTDILLGTIQNNVDGGGGIYETSLAPFPFLVIKQTGTALRVLNLGIQLGQPGYADEDELLAEHGKYQLIGYVLGDSDGYGKPKFYKPNQFNQFAKDTKRQLQFWEGHR